MDTHAEPRTDSRVDAQVNTQIKTEGDYLGQYRLLPFHVRLVGLFLFGLAPVGCLLVIGTGAVPNLAVLEAAAADTIITIIVVALLMAIPVKGRSRLFAHFASYAIALLLTVWWMVSLHARYWNLYANTMSISLLMGLLICGYLLRVHLAYRSRRTMLEYLHVQFKTDTILIILAVCYYGFSDIFQAHFAGVAQQIAVIAVSCILLWAYMLWQIETMALGRTKPSWASYFGVVFAALVAIVIERPAISLMNAVNVKTQHYDPGALLFKHPKKAAHHRPHHVHHTPFTSSASHDIAVALLAVAIIALIVYFVAARKKRAAAEVADTEPEDGVMNIVKRNRLSQRRGLAFLQTSQPLRRRVQSWLKGLSKKGAPMENWETIRSLAAQHQQHDIQAVLTTYEQIRYDPETDRRNE